MMWDPEQYWEKARVYARRALDDARESWEQPFWSALALEFLARAALATVHPALNADPTNEANLFYAFGYEIKGQPRSLPVHAVLSRLERLVPEFDKPNKDFCDFFVLLRNRELHTSELAFQGLAESEWLPRYYQAVTILCGFIERDVADLLGNDTAATAGRLIEALTSNKKSEVLKSIAAHEAVFSDKPEPERERLAAEQEVVSRTWTGASATTQCPACGSVAQLTGELERESEPMFDGAALFVEQTYLAGRMECGACDLVLKDIEEIHHAGLEPHFKRVVETDLHAYFEPEYYDEYNNM